MRTKTGHEDVYLSKRMGFVKLALQHGAALVPCYAFGTVDLYHVSNSQHHANTRGLLWTLHKKLGIAMPLYRGSFGFMPKRRPVDLVFGEPIEPVLASPGAPTDAEVQAMHATYVVALKQLFDRHKGSLGYGDRELTVS
jgi:diacylglycerol O-acyltransferase 2, plant